MFASTLITLAACGAIQATTLQVSIHAPQTAQTIPSDAGLNPDTLEVGALLSWGNGKVYDVARTPTSISQVIVRVAWQPQFYRGRPLSMWMRGKVALVVEGVKAWIDQDPSASGLGLNVLFRYTWTTNRWQPMFLGGAGILYTDEQVPPGETTRNFTPQVGLGLQYLVQDELAIGGEYRFHHLSNKGATETNPGINTHLILFGVSWDR